MACGGGDSSPPPDLLTPSDLALKAQTWNSKSVPVGKIAAVAELYDDTVVFGDQGAMVFTSGLLLNADATVKAWKQAGVIPAGDLSGDWLFGLDGSGAVRRLANRKSMEDVSDRYALKGTPVQAVAALGKGLVGFSIATGLAVADGKSVTKYNMPFPTLAGGGGRAVTVAPGAVQVFDPVAMVTNEYKLPGVVAAVFDAGDHLLAVTDAALYLDSGDGQLKKIFANPGAPFTAMVAAGPSVWLAAGDQAWLYTGGEIKRGPAGSVPAGARLIGSPSGDLWLLKDGALSRVGEDSGGGADQDLWKATVLPVFTRTCSLCHLPMGSSGIDLSTYKTWASRRALMNQRVVLGKPTPMPPNGAGMLTPDEMEAVKAWIANMP